MELIDPQSGDAHHIRKDNLKLVLLATQLCYIQFIRILVNLHGNLDHRKGLSA